jgi:hypothetical protein
MPLTRIPPGRLRLVAVPALVVYLLAFLPFLLVGDPQDMVRLQLAGSEAKAQEIVAGWTPGEAVDMAFLQGIDFVHPLAYGLLLTAGAVWAGRRLRGRLARWSSLVAWVAAAASLFDVLENVGMIAMIRGDVGSPAPQITTAFALGKYAMFLVVMPYVLAGLVARRTAERATG